MKRLFIVALVCWVVAVMVGCKKNEKWETYRGRFIPAGENIFDIGEVADEEFILEEIAQPVDIGGSVSFIQEDEGKYIETYKIYDTDWAKMTREEARDVVLLEMYLKEISKIYRTWDDYRWAICEKLLPEWTKEPRNEMEQPEN